MRTDVVGARRFRGQRHLAVARRVACRWSVVVVVLVIVVIIGGIVLWWIRSRVFSPAVSVRLDGIVCRRFVHQVLVSSRVRSLSCIRVVRGVQRVADQARSV